jgi:acetyl-CoA carboxylase biotin carboxyl carrier protein
LAFGKKNRETGMSSASGSSPGDPFDIRKVRRFIELMNEHDLAEVDLRQGDQRIRLRRGPEMVTVAGAVPPLVTQHTGATASKTEAGGPAAAAEEDANYMLIKSPMVGTFYSAANPETPPFIKVGDQVGPETTVCIVEAMKVFNEIPAECAGKIAAVLVANGDSVEYGQPLFRVQPNV